MGHIVNIGRPASTTIGAAEADPTTSADGVTCEGFAKVAVTFTNPTGGISYDLQIWLYDGAAWARAADSAGALIDIDGITTTWAQTFDVAGFSRIAVQVNNGANFGAVTRQYALARL